MGAGSSEYKMLCNVFARVNYTLMDQYLLEVNMQMHLHIFQRSPLDIFLHSRLMENEMKKAS